MGVDFSYNSPRIIQDEGFDEWNGRWIEIKVRIDSALVKSVNEYGFEPKIH